MKYRDIILRLNYLKQSTFLWLIIALLLFINVKQSQEYSWSDIYIMKFLAGNSIEEVIELQTGSFNFFPFGWMLLMFTYFFGLSSFIFDDFHVYGELLLIRTSKKRFFLIKSFSLIIYTFFYVLFFFIIPLLASYKNLGNFIPEINIFSDSIYIWIYFITIFISFVFYGSLFELLQLLIMPTKSLSLAMLIFVTSACLKFKYFPNLIMLKRWSNLNIIVFNVIVFNLIMCFILVVIYFSIPLLLKKLTYKKEKKNELYSD